VNTAPRPTGYITVELTWDEATLLYTELLLALPKYAQPDNWLAAELVNDLNELFVRKRLGDWDPEGWRRRQEALEAGEAVGRDS
jgi:hypothetical protein